MLDPNEVAGPTTSNHQDGQLFDEDGDPVYCQFMSMHWGVADARDKPEVVAEVRSFLQHPTHFFAECQAVNAYENDTTHGHFLTPNGFLIAPKPSLLDFHNADYPFAQLDGPFKTVGGSEPAYSLPAGDSYKDTDIVMITTKGTPIGVGDVWMTGYIDGTCQIDEDRDEGSTGQSNCLEIGKVSYLGGHEYDTKVPISANPETQGTRLFLNSLFEAPCATEAGQPEMYLTKNAPATTTSSQLTFTLQYSNAGPTTALAAVLRDPIPAGSTFVSATAGGVFSNGEVRWNLQNLGNDEGGSVSFTVTLGAHGTYQNKASLEYRVGLNAFTLDSNTTSTLYDADSDGDGVVDGTDTCPQSHNPDQSLEWDVQNCGGCGVVCSAPHATTTCNMGICGISVCDDGYADCDGQYPTGCEYTESNFASDEANCGGCGFPCSPLQASGACIGGSCTIGGCNPGRADCNGLVADGCEYDTTGFQGDLNHCGNCATQCTSGEICQTGICVPSSCPPGTADCMPGGTCETDILTSGANCGGCGVPCSPSNAAGSCVSGSCTIGGCNAGSADCNGLPGDGCEYPAASFATDPNNCGACGIVCSLANAGASCSGGNCVITGCAPDFSDCNGNPDDGCEYAKGSFANDPDNCGGCGIVCTPANASALCQNGSCTVDTCDPGFVDLDGNAANGCELECTVTGNAETACNGIDDDCNGQIDEIYVAFTCGVGACSAQSRCSFGSESCTPAQPGTEGPGDAPNCIDGADNDCDAAVDEDDLDCEAAGGSGGTGTSGAGGTGTGGTGEAGAAGDSGGSGPSSAGAGGATGTGGSRGGSAGASAGSANGVAGNDATGGSGAMGGDTTAGNAGSGNDAPVDSGDAGGCACRMTERSDSPTWAGAIALLAMAAVGMRRRTRDRRDRKQRIGPRTDQEDEKDGSRSRSTN